MVALFNATVANNFADADLNGSGTGGGIVNVAFSDDSIELHNSLVADNWESQFLFSFYVLKPNDCRGALTSFDYNLLGNTTDCTFTTTVHDQTNVAAGLDGLQDNGGPTLTQALLPGSLAIDTADPAGCRDQVGALLNADQRGRPRPANGAGATRCDIGAFELQRLLHLPLVRR